MSLQIRPASRRRPRRDLVDCGYCHRHPRLGLVDALVMYRKL